MLLIIYKIIKNILYPLNNIIYLIKIVKDMNKDRNAHNKLGSEV